MYNSRTFIQGIMSVLAKTKRVLLTLGVGEGETPSLYWRRPDYH